MRSPRYTIAECRSCNECRPFTSNGYDASVPNAYAEAHNKSTHPEEINSDLKMTTRNATPLESLLIARTGY